MSSIETLALVLGTVGASIFICIALGAAFVAGRTGNRVQ